MHSRRVSDMHKCAIGVPNLPIATEIDDCPICLKAELHKANKSTSSTRNADQWNQGISIDFEFVVQSSKDSERVRRLSGLRDETCYVLLCDHFSNTLYGAALRSPRLLQWTTSSNGLPPRVLDQWWIPNTFGWTLEESLAADKKSLTCLLKSGTQASQRLPTRPTKMGPWSVPIETLEIRSLPYALRCLLDISFLAIFVLSLPPTPQHEYLRCSGEDSVRTLFRSKTGHVSLPSAIVCTSSLLVLADLPRPRSTHILVFLLAMRRP
jgi:hypothetical protein